LNVTVDFGQVPALARHLEETPQLRLGTRMSEQILLGIIVALTPSLLAVAWFVWQSANLEN
jgi:hypothetical protein